MDDLFAKCTNNTNYEWLLDNGYYYSVIEWTDKAIVIDHPRCGKYGLIRDRFEFYPPENVVVNFEEYQRTGTKVYIINE